MSKIIALFSVLIPHLSATTTRQLSQVVLALLAMTGRVTMLNISRWTGQGVATALCKGFSTLLSLGLRFAGRFFALICLIVKVTISS